MKPHPLRIATSFAILLTLIVIVLGAYTRLTDAGLGCPDWPGCYGHLIVPPQEHAAAAFPDTPLETRKAWTEMVHRYVAGSLGLLVLGLSIAFACSSVATRKQKLLAAGLVLLIIFQALLGMWTVTLKLFPAVVMGHLLGGFLMLSGLWWLRLSTNSLVSSQAPQSLADGHLRRHPATHSQDPDSCRDAKFCVSTVFLDPAVKPRDDTVIKIASLIGLAILVLQIALGGWVSANYAGLACVGFPHCNGQLLPPIFWEAFNPFLPIGANYEGGIFDSATRVSIHTVHRIGAVITASYLLILATFLLFKTKQYALRRQAYLVISLVLLQFSLGIINVVKLLPLSIAVAHNAVAALLLLAWITLIYYLYRDKSIMNKLKLF